MDGWDDLSSIIKDSEDSENRTIALCVYTLKQDIEEIKSKMETYKWVMYIMVTMMLIIMGMLGKIMVLVR